MKDSMMRGWTRSGLLAAVHTTGARWVVPTRLTAGMLLLFPIDGGVQHLLVTAQAAALSAWIGAAFGPMLRVIEIIAGVSFLAGLGIRLAARPAVLIFGMRAVSNASVSSVWLRDMTSGMIAPHGNWAYGALYLATALLLDDLAGTGSGRWSIDYWLSAKLKAAPLPSPR
jgi:putative oxidoreductase